MRISNHDNQVKLNISKVATSHSKGIQQGDVFKGEILDIKHNSVLIQLSNGQNLMARITQQMEFTIGQKVLFQVKDLNNEQIFLKPVLDEFVNPKDNKLLQVLEEAGVAVTKDNIRIVESLIDNKLPIDKEFINQIVQYSRQFKDVSIDNLLILLKNNIPITKENVEQLSNYMSDNHSIKQEMMSLVDTIMSSDDIHSKEELIKILKDKVSLQSSSDIIAEPKKYNLKSLFSENQLNALQDGINNNILKNNPLSIKLSGDLDYFNLKDYLNTLNLSEIEKNDIMDTISNKIISNNFNKNMFMDISILNKPQQITDYYNEIYERINNLIQYVSLNQEEKNTQMLKGGLGKLKNNIEFMNDLNNNFNYIQLPLKLNDKLLKSELYVLQDKKELRSKRENDPVTALLRLDFASLGHMDIYVAKTSNNLECKFYVEDDNKKDIVNKHINTLYNQLKSINLNITSIMVMNNKKDFDIIDDFLNKSENKEDIKRYSFDMRV